MLKILTLSAAPVALALASLACGDSGDNKGTPSPNAATTVPTPARSAAVAATSASTASTGAAAITVSSSAFTDGGNLPVEYSCNGKNSSPPLSWSGAPGGTKAFALVEEDLDVPGIFDHWVLYDLPATVTSLDAGIPAGADVDGGKQGKNRAGAMMYAGACPPPGASPHHYRFTVFALDAPLGLAAGAMKAEVVAATQGHVLGQGQLTALFSR